MAIPSMQESPLLEGASNFVPWKLRLQNLLEMANLWYLVEKVVAPPTYPKDIEKHKLVNAK
jgi:hypothetical protein